MHHNYKKTKYSRIKSKIKTLQGVGHKVEAFFSESKIQKKKAKRPGEKKKKRSENKSREIESE